MNQAAFLLVFFVLPYSAPAQTVLWRSGNQISTIWAEQPLLRFGDDQIPRATVPREMIASLVVDDVRVVLEANTELETLRLRFGGEIGHLGDAGDSLQWLCLHGNDAIGPWVLWLDSSEIDGPNVGGFQWRRVPPSSKFDKRCATLPDAARVELPIELSLGAAERKIMHTLGRPTLRKGDVLLYEHEHNEIIRGEEFTSFNSVTIALRNGVVWVIEANKTTTN